MASTVFEVMLNKARIEELASRKGVKRLAVENFLCSLYGISRLEAVLNLEQDARSYRWNTQTKAAIRKGISEHFKR